MLLCCCFVNDTATTEIYSYGHTLSLHDALPISSASRPTPCLGCISTPSPGAPLRGRDARRGARRWDCAPPSICCKRATAAKSKKKAIVEAVTQPDRSEEHTSELQSLMRISYAVFCLKKKKQKSCTYKHTNTYSNSTHIRRSLNNKS